MASVKPVILFLLQSVVAGLAVAFVVVLLRPELLPALGNDGAAAGQPASYADAVERSAPAVASVYTRRVVQATGESEAELPFRINTSNITHPL